jgi:hypothetical protein
LEISGFGIILEISGLGKFLEISGFRQTDRQTDRYLFHIGIRYILQEFVIIIKINYLIKGKIEKKHVLLRHK